MLKWILLYIAIFAVAFGLSFLGVPMFYMILAFLGVALVLVWRYMHTIFWSKNNERIEATLKKQEKNPYYAYVLAVGHNDEAAIEANLATLITLQKQPYMHHYYSAIQAISKNQFAVALEHAERIDREPYGNYVRAYIEAVQGREARAKAFEQGKPWMPYAINALLAFAKKDVVVFDQEVANVAANIGGINHYLVTSAFANMRQQIA